MAVPSQRRWLVAFKPGPKEEKVMVKRSVCPGVGSFPSAWSKRALWSAVTSPIWELLQRGAVVCRPGGESEQDDGCSPALVQGEGGGCHLPPHPWFRTFSPALVVSVVSREAVGSDLPSARRGARRYRPFFRLLLPSGCPRGLCVCVLHLVKWGQGCRAGV